MPPHNVHKAFCEVIFDKIDIDKSYVKYSIYPDIDIIGLHRIKYHSLLNIDKLYKKSLEFEKKEIDKKLFLYAVLTHVYLDQFTAPVFWQGFRFPAYFNIFDKYVTKQIDITSIRGYIKLQKNLLMCERNVLDLLKIYDKYLTNKFFKVKGVLNINNKINEFKKYVSKSFNIDKNKYVSFFISSLAVNTKIKPNIYKVVNKLSDFVEEKINYKFYYSYDLDMCIAKAIKYLLSR